jgi:biotin carboxyl carrier protein
MGKTLKSKTNHKKTAFGGLHPGLIQAIYFMIFIRSCLATSAQGWEYRYGTGSKTIMVSSKRMELEIEGQTFDVQIEELSAHQARILVDGRSITVNIHPHGQTRSHPGSTPTQTPSAAMEKTKKKETLSSSGNTLDAMMPGTISKVLVHEGQQVETGQVLLVLEAMKMENEIRSDRNAIIENLYVSKGQRVQSGEIMISFKS